MRSTRRDPRVRRTSWRSLRAIATALIAMGGVAFYLAGQGAGAATQGGAATLFSADSGTPQLVAGTAYKSDQQFTVHTPASAACSGTGPNGYKEAGYIFPATAAVTGATYNPQSTSFSAGGLLLYNGSSQAL